MLDLVRHRSHTVDAAKDQYGQAGFVIPPAEQLNPKDRDQYDQEDEQESANLQREEERVKREEERVASRRAQDQPGAKELSRPRVEAQRFNAELADQVIDGAAMFERVDAVLRTFNQFSNRLEYPKELLRTLEAYADFVGRDRAGKTLRADPRLWKPIDDKVGAAQKDDELLVKYTHIPTAPEWEKLQTWLSSLPH